jgi:septal ring factor EnvC (AmiA/AmiB activator)
MAKESTFFIRRLERGIKRREKRVAKVTAKLEKDKAKLEAGKLTRAQFQKKLQEHDTKIRVLKARIQTFKGAIGKERRRLETGEA